MRIDYDRLAEVIPPAMPLIAGVLAFFVAWCVIALVRSSRKRRDDYRDFDGE